jgi:hypothetical protein
MKKVLVIILILFMCIFVGKNTISVSAMTNFEEIGSGWQGNQWTLQGIYTPTINEIDDPVFEVFLNSPLCTVTVYQNLLYTNVILGGIKYTYHAMLINVEIVPNPTVINVGYAIKQFTFKATNNSSDEFDVRLFDYQPKAIPTTAESQVNAGLTFQDKEIKFNIGAAYSQTISEAVIINNSDKSIDKCSLTIDFIQLSSYTSGTVNFDFVVIFQDAYNLPYIHIFNDFDVLYGMWALRDIELNADNFGQTSIISITNNPCLHQIGTFVSIDSTQHLFDCDYCNYSKYEAHDFISINGSGNLSNTTSMYIPMYMCRQCGYTSRFPY